MILRSFIKHVADQNWFAVGLDAVVVIVGVFLGFQLSQWNADRETQTQVSQYIQALKHDLAEDKEMLIVTRQQIDGANDRVGELINYSFGRSISEMSNLDLLLLTDHRNYRPYQWNRTTLNQLKASGSIRKIQNNKLRELIAAYEALSQHLDLDFETDEAVVTEATALANKVVDMNYGKYILDLNAFDPGDHIGLDHMRGTVVYKAADSLDRPLLVSDVREVRKMVNAYIGMMKNLQARTDHEIPKLVQIGHDIVTIIDAEYSSR